MRKRILSLFLAVVMIVLAVPTLAIVSLAAEAGEGDKVVYSTSFSSDPNSKNFPTIDLPKATEESKYVWNGLDYTDVNKWKEDGSFKSGGYKEGAVTYNGNWEIGTIGVIWDPAGTAAPTVNADSFYPYTDVHSASQNGEFCITTTNAIWGQNNVKQSGGLWLNSARNCMVAGIVYNKLDATPETSSNDGNASTVTDYVGTAAIRYTAEYAGTVDLSVITGAAYHNGIDLVILHNGTPVYTADNKLMDLNVGTDFGTVATLDVKKGDKIDFVCLGDVDYDADSFVAGDAYPNEAKFDYNHTKRGLREFNFTLNYTSVGVPYSTTLTPGGENWPTVDGYAPTSKGYNSSSFSDGGFYPVTYTGGWDMGKRPHGSTAKDDFEVYTNMHRTGSTLMLTSNQSTAYWSYNGGIYFASFADAMMFSGMDYSTENGNSRAKVTARGDASIRYTAEYTGDVIVSIDTLKFNADDAVYFKVLHNGVEVASLLADNGRYTLPATDAADRTMLVNGPATNMASAIGTNGKIALSVKAGDTIEFVNYGNENYRNDVALGTDSAYGYLDWSTTSNSKNAYNCSKRGAYNYSFTVTYEAGYDVPDIVDVWTGSANATIDRVYANSTANKNLYFFNWYQPAAEEGGEPTYVQPGSAVTKGCYAVPNPDLIAAGVFSADDTYKVAMEKYCQHMKNIAKINYDGAWQMGENLNGKFEEIVYVAYLQQVTPYMLNTSSKISGFSSNRWISERSFDLIFEGFYDATWTQSKNVSRTNATIPTEDTKISDIWVEYSADLAVSPSATEGYGKSKAPTSVGTAVGGLENVCWDDKDIENIFWVRASNSTATRGSFAYTAPQAGTLQLTADMVDFYGNAVAHGQVGGQSTKWALFVNGEQKTNFAWIGNYDQNDSNKTMLDDYKTKAAAAINAGLAAAGYDTIKVNKGDRVEICIIRSDSGYHVKMGLTATLVPELGVAANLVIDDSYAMNLYVQPVDPNATEAGVILHNEDGTDERLAGVKQDDGSFKVTVAEEIKVFELTHSTSDKKHADDAGVSVTYTPYEIGGMYLEGAERTSATSTLLADYTASSNAKVANLAKAVQALAIASNAALNKGGVVDGDSGTNNTKKFLKGGSATDKYDKDGDPANGAEADINASCPNDVLLASWHYYTMLKTNPEYAKPTYNLNEGGGEVKILTNANVAGIENGMPYGYAEGVNPTDASKYAYAIASANVNMGDKLSMVFLVSANAGNSLYELKNGYRLKITGAGQDYYGDFYTYELKGKTYMGVIVDVPVKYYDTNLTVTVVDGGDNAVSASLSYSVMTWCARVYDIKSASSSNAYVVKAVYMLGKAAAAYTAK